MELGEVKEEALTVVAGNIVVVLTSRSLESMRHACLALQSS